MIYESLYAEIEKLIKFIDEDIDGAIKKFFRKYNLQLGGIKVKSIISEELETVKTVYISNIIFIKRLSQKLGRICHSREYGNLKCSRKMDSHFRGNDVQVYFF